jgi:dTDP-4-dehydrorhamnose 3,5-epimerase
MRFTDTRIEGAFIVDVEPYADGRGLFARTFCEREFAAAGLAARFVQCSVSTNYRRGTLRGMHYQHPPAAEIKLVRCTAGAIYDVIVDLRPESPTFRQHLAVTLSARDRRALYIPEMVAHGFQTLDDDTEVFYHISQFYAPDQAAGVRFDDPALAIPWPLPVSVISEKDRSWPLLD